MKHTPRFDDGHFYHMDMNDPRYAASRNQTDEPEESFTQRLFSGLWASPARREDGEPVMWSSLFLNKLAADWIKNPFGFLLKLFSLTVLPALWSILIWVFATFALAIERPASCYTATFTFLWMLRDSVLSLPARPSLRDFLRLFFHEAVLKWLMVCTGIITYLYAVNDYNVVPDTAKWYGVAVAVFTYLALIERVAWRDGAAGLLRYLSQVFSIVCTTAFSTFAGFVITFILLDAPRWKCWAGAHFFGFVGLWIAVNLFYWPSGRRTARRELGEPLIQE
jgi:hypothetical protein